MENKNQEVELIIRKAGRNYLQRLDLSNKNLSFIPIQLYELRKLLYLDLSNNKISKIDKEIEKLSYLKELNLSNNNLNDLPKEIIKIESLEIINLKDNPIYSMIGGDFSSKWRDELKNFMENNVGLGSKKTQLKPIELKKEEGFSKTGMKANLNMNINFSNLKSSNNANLLEKIEKRQRPETSLPNSRLINPNKSNANSQDPSAITAKSNLINQINNNELHEIKDIKVLINKSNQNNLSNAHASKVNKTTHNTHKNQQSSINANINNTNKQIYNDEFEEGGEYENCGFDDSNNLLNSVELKKDSKEIEKIINEDKDKDKDKNKEEKKDKYKFFKKEDENPILSKKSKVELFEDNSNLSAQVKKLSKTLMTLNSSISNKSKLIEELNIKNERMNNENSELKKRIEELEKEKGKEKERKKESCNFNSKNDSENNSSQKPKTRGREDWMAEVHNANNQKNISSSNTNTNKENSSSTTTTDENSALLLKEQTANKRLRGEVERLNEKLNNIMITKGNNPSKSNVKEILLDEVSIENKIGEGGFAVINKGKWMFLDVAVKVIFDPKITDDLLDEFNNEIKMLSFLRHPNIVTLLATCKKPKLAILTEHVPRGSLFDILHKQK